MIYPDGTWNDQVNAFGNVLLEFEDPSTFWNANGTSRWRHGEHLSSILLPSPIGWNEAAGYAESLWRHAG